MLIEVRYFDLGDSARSIERRRLEFNQKREEEWRELTKGVEHFPHCPGCDAPPQPQRYDFVLKRGPLPTKWEMTCKCDTRLKYEQHSGGVALVHHELDYPPF